jgi:UDP-N-acetylglucosamine acyltransferase
VAREAGVDPKAVVDPAARIGRGVLIGPYCVVGPEVEIGDRCRLLAHVVIAGPTVLGEDNVVAPFASIGGDPQDLKYAGEKTRLEIGSRNRIREAVTLNRGTGEGGGVTSIGDDNLFMAYSHVAHDCRVGNGIVFGNSATLAGHVEVADGANVSAFAGVHQFCRVGREAFIGPYSAVTRDALPWVLTTGNLAEGHGINVVGLKRKGYPKEVIQSIKRCYMTLFRSKLKLEDAMTRVENELGEVDEVRHFLEFIRTSKRGTCR